MPVTHLLLLSGGSGKRLWPLSNNTFSKQFIRLFKGKDGALESMMMRAYRCAKAAGMADVIVATGIDQVSVIHGQLGNDVSVCAEPCRRDTFPAIALSAALMKRNGAADEDAVITAPVDAYVDETFYMALRSLAEMLPGADAKLLLLGIRPDGPSEKYGYIMPEGTEPVSRVAFFREKPDTETAARYIRDGALWNSGVFAFRLGYMLEKARQLLGTDDYDSLLSMYDRLPSVSFDYAVAEKETSCRVVRFSGEWKDIGTWNSLSEVISSQPIGPAELDGDCENVTVVNQLNIPFLGMGLKNLVICAAPDGILAAEKEASVRLKGYAERMGTEVYFAERAWGSYQVLSTDGSSLTRRIVMRKGSQMKYHSHDLRDESWVITAGRGAILMAGETTLAGVGDAIHIPRGVKHRMTAIEDLTMIEVQTGLCLGSEDRKLFDDDGNRLI